MNDLSNETREIWFESDGARLFAVDSGGGTPVILLHGGLATHLAARRFAAPLLPRFRIITPDLRGSGRSIHAGSLRWDQLADDVAALMRHLGVARAVIGGTSFGAGCAVRVALRHPAQTAALLVLNPAYGGADVGLTPAQQAAMDAMEAVGRRSLVEGVQALHPLFAGLPEPLRDRARTMVDAFDPASVAASTRFMASGAQPFASGAELTSIAAPTLLVPGTDPTHPPEIAEVYARHLRRCTVRTVAGGWDAAYAPVIAEFLERALA